MNEGQDISVHDNLLESYEVFCRRREIHLHTVFRDRGEPFEFTDVIFTGVTAYDFCHDSDIGTIIYDIREIPATDIYAENAQQFRDGIRWGWPGEWAQSAESAAAYFQQHQVRGFELSSSCGMSGWVLAKQMQKKRLKSESRNV